MKFYAPRLFRHATGLRLRTRVGAVAAVVSAILAFGQAVSPTQIPEEEYAVLSAVLDHFGGKGTDVEPHQHLVVWGTTSRGGLFPDCLQRIVENRSESPSKPPNSDGTGTDRLGSSHSANPKHLELLEVKRKEQLDAAAFRQEISDEAASDWTKKNAESYPITSKLSAKTGEVVLLSQNDWDQLKGVDSGLAFKWQAFRQKYAASGMTELSRVGFNRDHTQAVVLVGFRSGPIGGDGYYALLSKEGGVWRVKHLAHAWLS